MPKQNPGSARGLAKVDLKPLPSNPAPYTCTTIDRSVTLVIIMSAGCVVFYNVYMQCLVLEGKNGLVAGS